ncbi:MAG: 1-deoxy-D-xylulose-5-phosphate reductoisomerase [Zoogloeaceae bacterium]|jgi:1-deoxy-D-xylulose-5-phosphate reductoisomerase|nr:1-deoxy-D-xylulose-5-phosphate reductoisomerase [Zoogloeaceae bacterium]
MQRITILGATGSIGQNTLAVLRRHPERYRVFALTAHRQKDKLREQCREFAPDYAVLDDAADAAALRAELRESGLKTEVLHGADALCQVAAAPEADTVMAAIVGAAGLSPAYAAAKTGKKILLANKEALVMAGALFIRTAKEHGATILPVDSEHNAIFQALPPGFSGDLAASGVRQLWLTASGGPFRDLSVEELAKVTPEQAIRHPNWAMGRKISVDSASMMNKGLEVIEAHWLFNAKPEQIGVVVHPQSIVHSLVEYLDGSMLAQLGSPDMRIPIAHALAWPERLESGAARLDLSSLSQLAFTPPDPVRFPCLGLAYDALKAGGTAPVVLNAANEIATEAFLARRLSFPGIARLVADALAFFPIMPADTLEIIRETDRKAREKALSFLA